MPTVTAARRSRAVARFEVRRVRAERSLPPEIWFPGDRHRQETTCWAVGQAERSVPHAAISFSASDEPRP